MRVTRRATLAGSAGALAARGLGLAAMPGPARAQGSAAAQARPGGGTPYDVAFDAYVFGYPAVYMEVTRRVRTAVTAYDPASGRAPMNQMGHVTRLLDSSFTDVVRANVDTLYDSAFLDLAEEPVVLTHPDFGDRYFLFPVLDQWSDVVAAPGTRTTGQGAAAYAIAAPGWRGEVPDGVRLIRSTTSNVWVVGRIDVAGEADVPAANALQRQVRVAPLSAWGASHAPQAPVPLEPGVDPRTPPVDQVSGLGGLEFFALLAELMRANPPHANDYPIVHRMARIGLVPGRPFDAGALPEPDRAAVRGAAGDALAYIRRTYEGPWAPAVNGWQMYTQGGTYGTHYLTRAVVAYGLFGLNLPEDAIYPNTRVDADGRRLNGANDYVVRMTREQVPPVADFGFWSLTMYTRDGFFVPNVLDRAALRGELVRANADGSVDLHVQARSPGPEREANWLPAPPGDDFEVQLRLYAPSRRALDGGWAPPPVEVRR